MKRILEPWQLVERSITKKYRKQLWSPFTKAVKNYRLINEGDRIAVCISGGKDSMLMAKLVQLLQRYSEIPFEAVYLVMDPGYSAENRRNIERNAEDLHVPIMVFESNIFEITDHTPKTPCYLCAKMRRGFLYAKAKELGCNKIALGHHFSDVIETTVMAMFHGSQLQGMMPKLHSTNFEGMELIRPMYLIREEDIIDWTKKMNLTFLRCACHFTENCSSVSEDGTSASKRAETKQLIRTLRKTNPYVEANLFKSAENVNLDRVIAWKKDLAAHSFLEEYRD